MKKVLFIDRDGTLIVEPEDFQIDSFSKLKFYPGAIGALAEIARRGEYDLVMVTNQDGLGTESFPAEEFWPIQDFIIQTLAGEGVQFAEVLIDPSLPEENSPNRKPGIGMLKHYLKGSYDLENSFVIGDRLTDLQLAENLGTRSIFLGSEQGEADLITEDWQEVARFVLSQDRKTRLRRKTNETEIDLYLDPDAPSRAEISTGLAFFDHMLEQIARHAQWDLRIKAQGDLVVDEHHTIEDVGIALGQALKQSLAAKKGLRRYAFLLPMDESQAQVSIDLGGRAFLDWQVEFNREYIGNLATEMFPHFFKSFCDAAACTLHIQVSGANEHHKVEAIFKAFAKVLGQAAQRDESGNVPSSKGSL